MNKRKLIKSVPAVEMFAGERSKDFDWLNVIHGEKVLSSIFSELSENRVKFEKPTHCKPLTEWIINNSPEDLAEVVDLLRSVLDRGNQDRV